ncbi:hypothetical protein [Bradyrhizobium sp. Leo121]|uniref:hypothetical protein n=1 Tax=Bradyrhizobium sp. Leo121 TaxID=1571195 RepID=UPI001028A37F|nr:hypothetical protein [Bradyrhizobium sp. Leo121]RZN19615.1 hypothetical protein CWO90_34915 [Bradyrhizobium sp. Leo121]
MAESFGNSLTLVEVTSDDGAVPTKQTWPALAKPSQALTLVLAAVPEGWTAEVVPVVLSEKQQRVIEQLKLEPGEVYKLAPK